MTSRQLLTHLATALASAVLALALHATFTTVTVSPVNKGADSLTVHAHSLPACVEEDSLWCVWNADNRGNGSGDSTHRYGNVWVEVTRP